MTVSYPFQTVFAVPMTCDSCVKDVSDSLYKLGGITKVEADLKDQLLSVEGTGAAVSILESFYQADGNGGASKWDDERTRDVRGLARMVQVSPTTTLIDLTLRGVAPGSYRATIREYGNLETGASSTGPVWSGGSEGAAAKGFLGTFEVGKDGRGSAYLDKPFQIWEIIGHAMVVSRQDESAGILKNDPDTVVGVIARSAGVWDNDKTVCSCTGKTLWEERKDEVQKGML
ncbi:Superoxide dismutase 1 copper chaperone [Colletotrichum siamense]|uniref:Superoxide dismutase 1 copper chaperone n=1 Tax=Colletotrichum siamense TaxID=690259 RepID=A0A9P5KAX4_COLSI|nr:Superoxide dismutase 1 copper chaperone [Colletotrichum siamense]KAF4866920.1 Superoxide dismutase 1 copper chaperone [Colletotrichum siamense]KAF4923357.1 Superoxide dismutase 1 copper chaperone [Colletotrichum viniferum]